MNESVELEDDFNNPNATFKEAESRLFPIGNPALLGHPALPLSPFDTAQFSNSLLPLVSATIREKLHGIAPAIKGKINEASQVFNSGFDLIEDTLRHSWRESPLNPYNFDRYLNRNAPNLFKHLPLGVGQPVYPKHQHHSKYPPHKHQKEKAPLDTVSYSVDNMMHDYGINGYKHFEESILKELEKQEELKVEATIHTLFNQGDRVEVVHGKHHATKSGWQPIAAPTKTYDDSNDITSQIISPLHTSIFSLSDAPSESPDKFPSLGFHDFDSFQASSSYSVNEEGIESKVKPVKARVASIRRLTSIPTVVSTRSVSTTTTTTKLPVTRSRGTSGSHRKRHNKDSFKITGEDSSKPKEIVRDLSPSESIEVATVVSKIKPKIHVQSLTTSKPKNHSNIDRNISVDATKANTIHNQINYESTSRFRIPTITSASTISATRSAIKTSKYSATTSTVRPKTVERETEKFVDRARSTGYRGKVRYGQSTTKEGDKN